MLTFVRQVGGVVLVLGVGCRGGGGGGGMGGDGRLWSRSVGRAEKQVLKILFAHEEGLTVSLYRCSAWRKNMKVVDPVVVGVVFWG